MKLSYKKSLTNQSTYYQTRPSPLNSHAIVLVTNGILKNSATNHTKYLAHPFDIAPNIAMKRIDRFVSRIVLSARACRVEAYSSSNLSAEEGSCGNCSMCFTKRGPRPTASRMPRFIPCPPTGEWM